jgi:hypothetical protein
VGKTEIEVASPVEVPASPIDVQSFSVEVSAAPIEVASPEDIPVPMMRSYSPELGEDPVIVSSGTFIPKEDIDQGERQSTPGLAFVDDPAINDPEFGPSLPPRPRPGNAYDQAIDLDGPMQDIDPPAQQIAPPVPKTISDNSENMNLDIEEPEIQIAEVDLQTQNAIESSLKSAPRRYTRKSALMQRDDTIDIEDEPAYPEKRRASSGKPIPLGA